MVDPAQQVEFDRIELVFPDRLGPIAEQLEQITPQAGTLSAKAARVGAASRQRTALVPVDATVGAAVGTVTRRAADAP